MFARILATLLLAFPIVLTTPVSSSAQSFDSVVSFGDSLSDNGNAFAISGGAGPPPPYFDGRFSNGPTWVELLNGPMDNDGAIMIGVPPGAVVTGTGNQNFAIGGARSDLVPPGQFVSGIPSGVPNQIGAYQAGLGGGGVPANTLFTLLAGANDVFDFFDANPAPTQAQVTAEGITIGTNVVTDVGQLLGVGAQTILVSNLPNIGATPAFNTNPLAASGGFLISATINGTIDAGLATLASANPTANIVQMDLAGLFDAVIANPAGFGLTNVTEACTASLCAVSPLDVQNQYLFWDSVHPTAISHAVIAQFALLTLGYAQGAESTAAFGEVGVWSRLSASDAAFDRAMSWLHGTYAQQNGLYAEVIGIDGDIDASGNRASYDYGLYGVRGGLDKQMGNFLVGGSGAIMFGDIGATAIKSDVVVGQGDIYGSAYFAPFFATAEIGAAVTAFNDIERNVGLGNVRADGATSGYQYGAAAEAGALLEFGSIAIIPAGRIEYVGAHIAGYDEEAPILARSYEDRNTDAVLASARLRAATKLASSGAAVFAEIGYEEFVNYSEDDIAVGLANNTAQLVNVAVDDPDARGLYFKAGANGNLTDAVSLDVSYGYSSHSGDGAVHSGKLRVKIRN